MSTLRPNTRKEWLAARRNGIGASEAACILGQHPNKSNLDLWEEKTGKKEPKDISGEPYVRYGTEAEEYLRELFALDFPQYEVTYDQFGMVSNCAECPFLFATLDGELVDRATGRKGILEIKTTEILNSWHWEKWNGKIPNHYYIQVLHQFLATGYDFAWLKAQIKHRDKSGMLQLTTRHYSMERSEVFEDIENLKKEEIRFWECVKNDRRPGRILSI